MIKLDRWGLDIPTAITVAKETDYSTRFALGRLNQIIQIETNPRSRAIHTVALDRVETLCCVGVSGKPCKGIDMVRRFNNERSYGERLKKAAEIVFGLEDNFDLRRYTPLDARICRHVPNVVGIFDHLMPRLGIPSRLERSVRFFLDGSLLTTPSRTEQWVVYVQKTVDEDGHPIYRCDRLRANVERREHDYSLVLC